MQRKYTVLILSLMVFALVVPMMHPVEAVEVSDCRARLNACLRACGANASCATECHASYRECRSEVARSNVCGFFDITYRLMGKPNTLSFCKAH